MRGKFSLARAWLLPVVARSAKTLARISPHLDMPLSKIISGAQTGIDRGALDAALALGFPCGGACPQDRLAEDGRIPDRYPVIELDARKYRATTIQNGVATILKVVSATGLQLHASAALVKGSV